MKQHFLIISPASASEYITRPTSSPSTKNNGMSAHATMTVAGSPRSDVRGELFGSACDRSPRKLGHKHEGNGADDGGGMERHGIAMPIRRRTFAKLPFCGARADEHGGQKHRHGRTDERTARAHRGDGHGAEKSGFNCFWEKRACRRGKETGDGGSKGNEIGDNDGIRGKFCA